jgi:hypothetical protein
MSAHSELQFSILQFLRISGWMAWVTHDPRNHPAYYGMVDVLALREGRLLAVEVKIPPDKPSDVQGGVMADLVDHGATICVATCLDDVLRFR